MMKSAQLHSNPSYSRHRPLRGLIALACLASFNAHAGGTISFGEDKSVSIGLGMRTSLTNTDNGTSTATDFNLDSIRLYMGASLNKYIKGTFNTEKDSNDNVRVIDAIGQFEFSDGFNI